MKYGDLLGCSIGDKLRLSCYGAICWNERMPVSGGTKSFSVYHPKFKSTLAKDQQRTKGLRETKYTPKIGNKEDEDQIHR
jgi:hypothetical protein